MNAKCADIIIVGSSFIGITSALLLSQKGLKVIIITNERSLVDISCSSAERINNDTVEEKGSVEPSRLFALSANTVEILSAVIDRALLESLGQPINQVRVVDGESTAKVDFVPQDIDMKSFGTMMCEHELRRELIARLRQSEVVETVYTDAFEIVKSDEHGVIVDVAERRIKAQLLLGCDGKFSKVRELMNIGVVKTDFHQVGIVCDIMHPEVLHNGVAIEKFYSTGPFAVLPKKGGVESAIVWSCDDRVAPLVDDDNIAMIEQMIKMKLRGYLGAISIKTKVKKYPICEINAQSLYKERMILLGDAAHAIHPIAGQGLNLGMRGVDLIVHMIAEAHALGIDFGSEIFCEEYRRRRAVDTALMRGATKGINGLFRHDSFIVKGFRRLGMRIFDRSSAVKGMVMRYASGDFIP